MASTWCPLIRTTNQLTESSLERKLQFALIAFHQRHGVGRGIVNFRVVDALSRGVPYIKTMPPDRPNASHVARKRWDVARIAKLWTSGALCFFPITPKFVDSFGRRGIFVPIDGFARALRKFECRRP